MFTLHFSTQPTGVWLLAARASSHHDLRTLCVCVCVSTRVKGVSILRVGLVCSVAGWSLVTGAYKDPRLSARHQERTRPRNACLLRSTSVPHPRGSWTGRREWMVLKNELKNRLNNPVRPLQAEIHSVKISRARERGLKQGWEGQRAWDGA